MAFFIVEHMSTIFEMPDIYNYIMGIFDKLFGKKQQQESLDQGLQKTREGL